MPKKLFEFELYRVNLVQNPPMLFEDMNKPVKLDQDIASILKHAAQPTFKSAGHGSKNDFERKIKRGHSVIRNSFSVCTY